MAKHIFKCIDAHTCGNPVRLVAEGGPDLQGNTMEEKRQHFMREFDWIRRGLMFEPRGHDMARNVAHLGLRPRFEIAPDASRLAAMEAHVHDLIDPL